MSVVPVTELRDPAEWERDASCNGCRRSHGVDESSPRIVKVLVIGSAHAGGMIRGQMLVGGVTEFRMCADCLAQLQRALQSKRGASSPDAYYSSERDPA